jgi:hypothetical protein
MPTEPLMRAPRSDVCGPVDEKREAEFRLLHMNWVVVTDTNGNRQPEMRWRVN